MSNTAAPPADPIAQVNSIRERILRQEDVSAEEMKSVLMFLRQGRKTIHETTAATKAKSSVPLDLSKLFE